ncbi:MAG: 4-hydroxy-tetrahydrodipicolinate synthase [Thermodesulfobacteriota bacterium]
MLTGTYTALITPFSEGRVDEKGLESLTDFQIAGGISGILAVGTTGESPTLTWEEHLEVVEITARRAGQKTRVIAGTGSNNTAEAMEGTRHARQAGACAVLLVDPYYNGPSSLEIRKEYVSPVAAAFPDMEVIPYVIPGRTGTQMMPEDLALLFQEHKNVSTVKEATGDLSNMARTRSLCGPDYSILSGDDPLTIAMMNDPGIRAQGAISVMSNIAPKAVTDMVSAALAGDFDRAVKIEQALKPLFSVVTVTTMEESGLGPVKCRARNPLAVKTLMAVLGMPAGPCRRPLGRMTAKGLSVLLSAARTVLEKDPWVYEPLVAQFGVNVEECLHAKNLEATYAYPGY